MTRPSRCRRLATAALSLALLAGSAGSMTGCLAAAAGAGVGGWYAFGEDTMFSDHGVEPATAAVRQAFDDYGVTYTGTEKKPDGAMITGTMPVGDDQEIVKVGVWDKPGEQTKIEVRIGTFSQETQQRELMGKIQARLDAIE